MGDWVENSGAFNGLVFQDKYNRGFRVDQARLSRTRAPFSDFGLRADFDAIDLRNARPQWRTAASLELRQGRPAPARARAQDILREYAALDLLAPARARARRVLVEAMFQLGEADPARARLTTYIGELHAHAQQLADPPLRASFLQSVPDHARLLALASEHTIDPR